MRVMLFVGLLVARSVGAWADGCFFPPADFRGADLAEPEQRAIAIHLDGMETLLLFVDYAGAAGRFGWVVPVPSKPEVALAEPGTWNDVVDGHGRLQEQFWQAWRTEHADSKGCAGSYFRTPPTPPGVEAHLAKTIGAYGITVLSSTEPNALGGWLVTNGFRAPVGIEDILASYVREKWFFVAVKVILEPTATVSLTPLAIRFATERLVYPVRLGAGNRGTTRLVLYTLDALAAHGQSLYAGGSLDAIAVDDVAAFRAQNARLLARAPELRSGERALVLQRHEQVLVPQVTRQLSDHVVRHRGALDFFGAKGSAEPIMANAVATALASDNPYEAVWGQTNLGAFRADHVTGDALSAQLGNVGRARVRDQLTELIASLDGRRRRGAIELLRIVGGTDDPGLIARLERVDPDTVRASLETVGTIEHARFNTLGELGSPASRRALARIARSASPDRGYAAERLLGSLRSNPISKPERLVAARELVGLMSGAVEERRVIDLARGLLCEWTGRDFGENWGAWRAHLDANAAQFAR